ncbi:hypothetical protein CRP01_39900 [Flavilitoribacter nigricans DSM 23189 = NBRC 102662]|uniref:Uncharacterized protein n=1 Tax=Flavilitoribacter nigricans (strain ATCC 23147 / DSM 23189 / NBRC 102662 / NCIMB 1420 / SS-2) TaxID=1122177 RepID=A0A2D0MXE2_FLAN2|nr:hypothetical protein CRP01_39900 [Flavilitoribacter nigricans DSM 23189 = NBRC 102662]
MEELALVTSELCENAIKHAIEGTLILDVEKGGRILVIRLKDRGPGISDISMAMEKGYSSVKGSLGLGLEIVRRLMDDISIKSIVDQGTTIVAKKFLPLTTDIVEYGLLSIAADGYLYNGDAYVIKEFDGDSVLLSVIDGVGQGLKANLAASFMGRLIKENYRLPTAEILEICHELFKKGKMEGGAAVSIARLMPGKLEYAGIGDTHAYWINDKLNILKNIVGSVGNYNFKPPIVQEIPLSEPVTLCLCTDGIRNLLTRPPMEEFSDVQQLAKMLYNHHSRSYGDVTALVAHYKLCDS